MPNKDRDEIIHSQTQIIIWIHNETVYAHIVLSMSLIAFGVLSFLLSTDDW